jgi:hypothetical protein
LPAAERVTNGGLVNVARWAALPAAVAISFAAGGCGGSGSGSSAPSPPSTSTLTSQVRTAVHDASSVHIDGTINEASRAIGMNISMTRAGEISGQMSANGAGFTVLSTQGSTYIKVTDAFLKYLRLPATACNLVCGKYLKATNSQASSLTGQLSMASIFGRLNSSSPPTLHYSGTATVNGQTAWMYHSSDGGTVYVAAHGKPYPLRIVAPSNRGKLTFSKWNSVTIPGPPPSSQVVDLSQLHG